MEILNFDYEAQRPLMCRAHVGVVGSGDLEVLIEPSPKPSAHVRVRTSVLVERELNGTRAAQTAGERLFRRYALTGARGQAASGYALVRAVALPVYDRLRLHGVEEDLALLEVLLHLLAVNDDTNLVSRGGLDGLNYVREYARKLVWKGGALAPDGSKKMEAFDDELIARHLSPGGSADLLGVTWFLAQFPHSARGHGGTMIQEEKIEQPQGYKEVPPDHAYTVHPLRTAAGNSSRP